MGTSPTHPPTHPPILWVTFSLSFSLLFTHPPTYRQTGGKKEDLLGVGGGKEGRKGVATPPIITSPRGGDKGRASRNASPDGKDRHPLEHKVGGWVGGWVFSLLVGCGLND